MFSPADEGVPADRRRRYVSFVLGSLGALDFREVFFRRLQASGSVYFVGGEDDHDKPVSASRMGHIEGYILSCMRKGLFSSAPEAGIWHVPHAIVNANNTDEWGSLSTEIFPTQMTGSELYCLVHDRRIHIRELYLAMGFPHPDVAEVGGESKWFPFPSLLEPGKLRSAHHKHLIGNSMHVIAVGSWIAYTLGCMHGLGQTG